MKFRHLLTATALAAATVPASAQDTNVEGRVVKLEKEMRAVQRKVFPDGAGRFLEADIQTPAATATAPGTPANSAVSDLITRVDALETQLATLTGQVETQGAGMKAMEERLKTLEGQLRALNAVPAAATDAPVETGAAAAVPASKAPASAKPIATPAKTAAPTKASAARVAAVAAIERPSSGDAFEDGYSYGYRLWEAKFYPEAQTQLQDVITKFPKHRRASFARNLLGRAWLDDGKPATAVKIFYDNYKADPKGERAPDSLYFLGEALTGLGKAAEACEAFGQLASAYPADATGRLASRLAEGRAKAKCK